MNTQTQTNPEFNRFVNWLNHRNIPAKREQLNTAHATVNDWRESVKALDKARKQIERRESGEGKRGPQRDEKTIAAMEFIRGEKESGHERPISSVIVLQFSVSRTIAKNMIREQFGAFEATQPRPPKERKIYSAEARQRAVAAVKIAQQAGKNQRMDVAREYITTLPIDGPRPMVRAIANQFHICQANACIVIVEQFGAAPEYKDEVQEYLRTLKERPAASVLVERFGISYVYANVLITGVFGAADRKATFRAGVDYYMAHPKTNEAELMERFNRSRRWAKEVLATARKAVQS